MTGSLFGSREGKHCCSNGAGRATARIPRRVGRYRCAADDEIARFDIRLRGHTSHGSSVSDAKGMPIPPETMTGR